MGPSFETISSSGPNGGIIHYSPTPETDRKLSVDEMYLCDSGGQFLLVISFFITKLLNSYFVLILIFNIYIFLIGMELLM